MGTPTTSPLLSYDTAVKPPALPFDHPILSGTTDPPGRERDSVQREPEGTDDHGRGPTDTPGCWVGRDPGFDPIATDRGELLGGRVHGIQTAPGHELAPHTLAGSPFCRVVFQYFYLKPD